MNPEHKIIDLKRLVESDKRSEIRLNANGGNSILLVCPPDQELIYATHIKSMLDKEIYDVIDLNDILITYVQKNMEEIGELFELLKGSIHQIFKSSGNEIESDLFSQIITRIKDSFYENKIPVLLHSGALYGSGIDNIHLMEHEMVMKSKLPLVILYPATQDGDKLMFLNSRPASKYRCMIIN
ncbi:MAG: hypothetical protein K2P31_03855 [Rickettsiaceae bacterium]|nr:hypothetical protein [Rickettsiaceae bacterium]